MDGDKVRLKTCTYSEMERAPWSESGKVDTRLADCARCRSAGQPDELMPLGRIRDKASTAREEAAGMYVAWYAGTPSSWLGRRDVCRKQSAFVLS